MHLLPVLLGIVLCGVLAWVRLFPVLMQGFCRQLPECAVPIRTAKLSLAVSHKADVSFLLILVHSLAVFLWFHLC